MPFVGPEIAAAAGVLKELGTVIAIVGEVSNTAMTFYTTIGDPSSAPMAIFGLLMGVKALPRNSDSFESMSVIRRGMSDDDIGKMGTVFKDQTALIKKIVRICGK